MKEEGNHPVPCYFNLHNMLHFVIEDQSPSPLRRLNPIYHEFVNYRVSRLRDPELTISLQKFTPNLANCSVYDDTFYLNEEYFFCAGDKYKIASWKFDVTAPRNQPLVVRIASNLSGSMMVPGFVIEPIIATIMASKLHPIAHAASLSKDRKGLILSGRSGSGKTYLTVRLSQLGYSVLGDDRAILGLERIYGFWSSLNIFSYNLHPFVHRKLTRTQKLSLWMRDVVYKATRGYVKLFLKVNPCDIFANLEEEARLHRVYILIPGKNLFVRPIAREEAIRQITFNERLDMSVANKYFLVSEYVGFPKPISDFWSTYSKALRHCLTSELEFLQLEVPTNLSECTDRDLDDIFGSL